MLFVLWLRWLRGYIGFRVSEGFPERFLNLCNQAGAAMWDLQWSGDAILGKTDRQGWQQMQNCAAAAGVQTQELTRVGLPFLLRRHRRRAWLAGGLAVSLGALWVLSHQLWSLRVEGWQSVPPDVILQTAAQLGLRQGAWREQLDLTALKAGVLQELPQLSWVSINVRGSTAVIEVREQLRPRVPTGAAAGDVVARKAGQLVVLEVYSGQPSATVGQAVLPGDVLVGSQIANADSSVRQTSAAGYAVARTQITCTGSAQRRTQQERFALQRTRWVLQLLGLQLPLGLPVRAGTAPAFAWQDRYVWVANQRPMPLALERNTVWQTRPHNTRLSNQQMQLRAAQAFFSAAYAELRMAQVLHQEVELQWSEDECRIVMRGQALENIG